MSNSISNKYAATYSTITRKKDENVKTRHAHKIAFEELEKDEQSILTFIQLETRQGGLFDTDRQRFEALKAKYAE
jgi:hypothetical protein